MGRSFNRRSFIKRSSLGAIIASSPLTFASGKKTAERNPDEPTIKSYRSLGRTGFSISDLSIGHPQSEGALKAGLSAGMNFIDTAHHYSNGNNERMVGKVIKDFNRKKIFLSTKMPIHTVFTSTQEVLNMVRGALERLDVEQIDCMQIHAAQSTAIVKNKYFHEGLAQLKAEGRVKHLGVSCHGAAWHHPPDEDLTKILMTAVDDGRFDVIEMVYNRLMEDKVKPVLRACKDKNIGTIVFKTSPFKLVGVVEKEIARMERREENVDEETLAWQSRVKAAAEETKDYALKHGFRDEDQELANACMQYALGNKDIDSCLTTLRTVSDAERWILPNSGKSLSWEQAGLLDSYYRNFSNLNCRIGCTDCSDACPGNVEISTITRYNYYFENKGQEKDAMLRYASLPGEKADLCADCPAYCEAACPYGVQARAILTMAHRNLTPGFA